MSGDVAVHHDLVEEAAWDDARWSDLLLRLQLPPHAPPSRTDDGLWASPVPAPSGLLDAVTLRPGLTADGLRGRVEPRPGASVRDAFGDLDLAGAGFVLLAQGRWVGVGAEPSPALAARFGPAGVRPRVAPWEIVRDPDVLHDWEEAWGGAVLEGLFPPRLLDEPAVTVLVARDGERVTAGCVLTRFPRPDGGGLARVVGVHDVFAADGDLTGAWSAVVGWVTWHRPGAAVVGSETGPALHAALAAGLEDLGPVRLWVAA